MKSGIEEKIDFDAFAKDYDKLMANQLKGFGEESAYFAEYKVRLVKERLQKTASPLPKRILEFGCGTGRNLTFLQAYFPDAIIEGCDISSESLKIAAERAPDVELYLLQKEKPKKHYDLVFVACVFHHIAPAERAGAFEQICMMMKPGSELFIFEHNPYNPVTRHMVNTCPFDKDAILLTPAELVERTKDAGLNLLETRYTLFYPAFLKALRPTEAYLGWLPLGGQYYVRAVK
ncbi:MAG: class I SAM-dependent methyltransferase [Candidatus Thermochlorobacter sp.]